MSEIKVKAKVVTEVEYDLEDLIREFIDGQLTIDSDEWYGSSKEFALGVFQWFQAFLKDKGIELRLPEED